MQIIATSDAHVARNRHRDKLVYILVVVVVGVVAGFVCFLIVVGGGWRLTACPPSACSPLHTPCLLLPLLLLQLSSAVTFCRRYGVRNCKFLSPGLAAVSLWVSTLSSALPLSLIRVSLSHFSPATVHIALCCCCCCCSWLYALLRIYSAVNKSQPHAASVLGAVI